LAWVEEEVPTLIVARLLHWLLLQKRRKKRRRRRMEERYFRLRQIGRQQRPTVQRANKTRRRRASKKMKLAAAVEALERRVAQASWTTMSSFALALW
jgi:hypothetical protein